MTSDEQQDIRYLYWGYVKIGTVPMVKSSNVQEFEGVWVNDDDPIELKEIPDALNKNLEAFEEQIEYLSPYCKEEAYTEYNKNETYKYWEELFDLEEKEVPQNDKERLASDMLRKGATYIDARIKAGLSSEEMEDLYNRLLKWEGENFRR